jgi:hypothetical protein
MEMAMRAPQVQDQAWKLAPELRRRLVIRVITNMVSDRMIYKFSGAYGLMDT